MNIPVKLPPYVVNDDSPVMPYSQTVDWGLSKFAITTLHQKGITGKGVKIGVLDTGVDTDHSDLKITYSKDFTNSGTVEDAVGHGTHTAGIIAAQGNDYGVLGVSPGVDLFIYKVLGTNSGSMLDVANAVRAAADDGMHIINMSLGSSANSPQMRIACEYAANKGVILVVSAGNSGKEELFYPASYDTCYATGAINASLRISAFSTWGTQLEFVAPGEKILSTYLNNGYAIMSGTSMAAPFASGCIALMKQAGVKLDYKTITSSVIDILDPNFDKKSGFGIINPSVSIEQLKAAPVVDNLSILKQEISKLKNSIDVITNIKW